MSRIHTEVTAKQHAERQQEVIEAFFKDFFSWDISNIGYRIMAVILVFCQFVAFVIPCQELTREDLSIMWLFGAMIVSSAVFYIQPYITYNDKNTMIPIYKKIKYLPVSRRALTNFRMKKLFGFVTKVFVADLVLQIIFALLITKKIDVMNFIYPIFMGFFLPLLLGGVNVLAARMSEK